VKDWLSQASKRLWRANSEVGLIRCAKIEDVCPGTDCFKELNTKIMEFESVTEEIELISISTCGGCPGKRVVTKATDMVRKGADTIAFASCIVTPFGFFCPHAQVMKDAIVKKLGDKVRVIDYTH
jgi:predicted metal-binding protein